MYATAKPTVPRLASGDQLRMNSASGTTLPRSRRAFARIPGTWVSHSKPSAVGGAVADRRMLSAVSVVGRPKLAASDSPAGSSLKPAAKDSVASRR
jgi:hypothetical protein